MQPSSWLSKDWLLNIMASPALLSKRYTIIETLVSLTHEGNDNKVTQGVNDLALIAQIDPLF